MLTNGELKQIKDFLALYGKKDNQLSRVNTVYNRDYIAIVQEGKNVTITVELLKRAVLEGIITDEEFNNLWDETPVEDSKKAVRSNGIWHAINDPKVIHEPQLDDNSISTRTIIDGNVTYDKLSDEIHNQNELFSITLACSPSSLWITNNTNFEAQLTTTNNVKYYGDFADEPVLNPYNPTFTATSGSINPETKKWALPHSAGSYTATYKAKRNESGIQKIATANILLYLSKFAQYDTNDPSSITTSWDLESHDTTNANCTIVIPAKGENVGYMNVYVAIPTNMITTGYHIEFTQPDALNAKFNMTNLGLITRSISSDNYSYTLFKSVDTIDATVSKKLDVKLVKN